VHTESRAARFFEINVVRRGPVTSNVLSGSSTYSGQTLASLGLTAGTYSWTIGANTIELDVTAVPESSSFLMLGIVSAGVAAIRRRKREGLASK